MKGWEMNPEFRPQNEKTNEEVSQWSLDLSSGSLATESVLIQAPGNITIKELEWEKFAIIMK